MTTLSQDSYLTAKDSLFLLENPLPSSGGDFLNGNLTISEKLVVEGATTLEATLNVVGATLLESTLNVDGATTLETTLDVKGAALLESTLGVSGATTLETTLDVKGTALVEGATTLETTLNVKGTSLLEGAVTANTTVRVSGDIINTGRSRLQNVDLSGNITLPVYSNLIPQPASGPNNYILGFGVLIPNPVDDVPFCVVLYSGASSSDYIFVSRNGVQIAPDIIGVLSVGARIPGVGFTVFSSSTADGFSGATFNYLIIKGDVVE